MKAKHGEDRPTAVAVWFPAARRVELRQERLPPLGPGQVRIRAIASAISHGTEMLVYRGQVPAGLELDLPTLAGSFSFPIKYGYACVGRVVEQAADVANLRTGDLVFTLHPHQSEFVVSADLPLRLPDGIEPLAGVFLANLETAVNIVLDAAPRLGERIAVFGQGVVGLLITQLLRRTGAGEIVAVEPLAPRRELAARLGAHTALAVAEGVSELDVAIEASGNATALRQAIECLAFGGTVVVCSWYGTKPVELQLGGAFHRRRLRIVSSQVGTIDGALQPRWTHARRLALACALLPQLELKPLISHCLPIERAAEAYQLIDEHPEHTMQVVLTYPDRA